MGVRKYGSAFKGGSTSSPLSESGPPDNFRCIHSVILSPDLKVLAFPMVPHCLFLGIYADFCGPFENGDGEYF
jgi:hypothetical protein